MYKPVIVFGLILFVFFNSFAGDTVLKDRIVFVFKDDVVTESDLRAFSFILKIPLSDRDALLEKVVEIEKSYYCLKESYPFEDDFSREFPGLFYEFNLLNGNCFINSEDLKKRNIDFGILRDNLFKLLFVIKYSLLLDEEGECVKQPVFFVN